MCEHCLGRSRCKIHVTAEGESGDGNVGGEKSKWEPTVGRVPVGTVILDSMASVQILIKLDAHRSSCSHIRALTRKPEAICTTKVPR